MGTGGAARQAGTGALAFLRLARQAEGIRPRYEYHRAPGHLDRLFRLKVGGHGPTWAPNGQLGVLRKGKRSQQHEQGQSLPRPAGPAKAGAGQTRLPVLGLPQLSRRSRGCTGGLPSRVPSLGQCRARRQHSSTAAPAPRLQQDKPLSTAPGPVLPRSSAWRAPARSLPTASSAPSSPQARATLPTQRPPRSPRARPFIAPHTSAAELGRNRAGEPCTHRGPVAPGAGNGYWFSGLRPFPFTC